MEDRSKLSGKMPENNDSERKGLLQQALEFWHKLIDLEEGIDREGTVFAIKNNRRIEGANAWMLMSSIMIASLGLDMNSPAIIIGAMLIAPLMAPILGIGLGVATNDFDGFVQSLKQIAIAVGIAIVTSTLYFWATPLGHITPEIMSRTSPTLLDVLVGVFGGIAGIVSTSRKDQSSAIPGVAIATALMPPLCVTGFGIATGNLNIALESFYLFFLNTFFVALATYLVVRLLRFPNMKSFDDKWRKRKIGLMVVITLIIVVPSAWIFLGVVQETRLNTRVESFLKTQFKGYEQYIDDWNLVESDSMNHLIIKVYGSDIREPVFVNYQDNLDRYRLSNTVLDYIPTSEVDLAKVEQIEAQLSDFEVIADQLTRSRIKRSEQDELVDSLRNKILQIQSDTLGFNQISMELKTIFPDLTASGFAKAQYNDFEQYNPDQPILWVRWTPLKSQSSKRTDEIKMLQFITTRTGLDNIKLVESSE
jgi:uncharacterized hydrophobic protein (TIGR00271 family)